MTSLDAALLLMALVWGTNYAIVKSAFRDIDPQAFNALRLLLASTVLAIASRTAGRLRLDEDFHTSARVTRDEWPRLIVLGLVGHGIYQYLFVGGLREPIGAIKLMGAAAVLCGVALRRSGRPRRAVGAPVRQS